MLMLRDCYAFCYILCKLKKLLRITLRSLFLLILLFLNILSVYKS
nr:MAG TPA: hypothetical protein [Caudoviricetes sp.]